MELRNRWPVMLAMMCVGWFAATSVTGLGMYMVACHTYDTRKVPQAAEKAIRGARCEGRWTIGEGHFVLVMGSLLNMMLLAIMLALLVRERRGHPVVQDLPPDYEVLIKEETPPPSFAEAQRRGQPEPKAEGGPEAPSRGIIPCSRV